MFNTDVTQTYDHLDASAEILIMLFGAFMLGYLLCWLLRQLFLNNSTVDANNATQGNLGNLTFRQTQAKIAKNNDSNNAHPSSSIKTAKKPPQTTSNENISDFKIINGISPKIEKLLRAKNINSYSDLRDIDNKTLNEILNSSVKNSITKQSIKTWAHQAALAAKGDWRKLSEYQDFIEQSMSFEKDITVKTKLKKDDLQKIKGIGPKIEKILNSKGIFTYKQLRLSDADTLKEYISNEDERFKNNQTATWSHQANMAEKGQWKELSIYQEFMNDINIDSKNLAATVKKSGHSSELQKLASEATTPNSLTANENKIREEHSFIEKNLDHEEHPNPKIASSELSIHDQNALNHSSLTNKELASEENKNSAHKTTAHSTNKTPKDDLKLIEGIEPKIEKILNKADIYTFMDLKNSNRDFLKSLLNQAGPQFRMHEPDTWPQQAEIAYKKDRDKLKKYQDYLSKGGENN